MNFLEIREGSWWQLEHIESIDLGADPGSTLAVVRFFSGVEEWVEASQARLILAAVRADTHAVEEGA